MSEKSPKTHIMWGLGVNELIYSDQKKEVVAMKAYHFLSCKITTVENLTFLSEDVETKG